MSRSGYSDDLDEADLETYRELIRDIIAEPGSQAFLRELAAAMDAMPEKMLITEELINSEGECCTIGVVCKARGVDVSKIDVDAPEQVAAAVGIAQELAAEIEYENDECNAIWLDGRWQSDTPATRWERMRKWVDRQLLKAGGAA